MLFKNEIEAMDSITPERELLESIQKSRIEAVKIVTDVSDARDMSEETTQFAQTLLQQADDDVRMAEYVSAYIRYEQIVAIGVERELLRDNQDVRVTDDVLGVDELPSLEVTSTTTTAENE